MALRVLACASGAAAAGLMWGCASPFDQPPPSERSLARTLSAGAGGVPPSRFRESEGDERAAAPALPAEASPDDFVRYALFHSPQVEAAYQRWRAASERLPQARALPDPRLALRYEFRPEEATIGVMQEFPWPGTLQAREDAATRGALAAWREFEAVRLSVSDRVLAALYELAYLDAAIRTTRENLELLGSLEEVVRARYRVGAGSHPELIRVQVELGQLEDEVTQLQVMRPAFVAEVNAELGREGSAEVPAAPRLPEQVARGDAAELAALARRSNPMLLALDEQAERQRHLATAARREGFPQVGVGVDYMFYEGRDMDDSGTEPVMLTLGLSLPLWRGKYDAAVREAMAGRLAVSHERADEANRIEAAIHRAWFEHTDAHRRVGLFEQTLIPKAQESLRASLAGFRAGDTSFLDLLDTERTLLEFAISAERARADRGRALARLNALVGAPVPTEGGPITTNDTTEDQP
jgi:cobalt-zinc-cadmium efflux system outer membrane protein